ncbi:MAG: DUF1622 domain-containing protein [Chloroflexota bacterium]|nr:DUF1622 domain-containing protein [Chloroflexota bacterium]
MENEPMRNIWSNFILPATLVIGLVLLLSLEADPTRTQPEQVTMLEEWLQILVGYLGALAEIAAALIIGIAVLRGIWSFFRHLFSPPPGRIENVTDTRLELGRALVLGLEFTVASDILQTAVAPTRQDLLVLAAVVLLRTLLNNFLEREIREVQAHRDARLRDAPVTESGE